MDSKRTSFPWVVVLAGAGVLLIAVALGWLAGSETSVPATPTPLPATTSEITRVTVVEAKQAYDAGSAVFVDVRDATSYALRHITGAVNIPYSELATRMGDYDRDTWVITY